MILRFSEDFLPCTNNLSELVLDGATVAECLNQAFERFPQLYVHLMDNKAEVALQSYFTLNSEYIYEMEECKREVQPDDVMELRLGVPTGAGGKILNYVMGGLQIIAGAIITWFSFGFNPYGYMLMLSGTLQIIGTALGEDPFIPDPGGSLNNSSAYTFTGIRNTTAAGTPLQIVYGTFRVGGQYVNIFTKSTSTNQLAIDLSNTSEPFQNFERVSEYLYAQIGLCEGEIEGASNFEINKFPTNFYNAIDFVDDTGAVKPEYFRSGTSDQLPMDRFGRTSNTTTVMRKVLRPLNVPTLPDSTLEFDDAPLWGYYDRVTKLQHYGYYRLSLGADQFYPTYFVTTADDPAKSIIKWDERNPYLDGPPWAPTQLQSGSFTVKRTYRTGSTLPAVTWLAEGATIVETQNDVDAMTLTLTLPGLYQMSQKDGYLYTTVSVAILYRIKPTDGSNPPWTVYRISEVIAGKQRAEITKSYDLPDPTSGTVSLPRGVYEVAVARNTDDHTGWSNYVDDIYIKELTEYQNDSLAYPHTALLGAVVRASDQLSGQLPSVTSLVQGMKIALPVDAGGLPITDYVTPATWSGQLSWDEATQTGIKYWSDNPIWCMYDLLINRRYGLADYYPIDPNKLPLFQAQCFILAQYCNQPIEYTDSEGAKHPRKRFVLNMVIDQSKSASEWLAAIAACCRAICFYTEGVFWVDIDRPKPVSQVFNMSEIKEYTQTGTSYRNIPNCYEVQYPNPQTHFEMDSFRVESQELQQNAYIEERKKTLTLPGVTVFDQAKALTKYALLTGQYLTKIISFKTGTNGLRSMVTNTVAIQHDVPQTGWGGKVVDVSYNAGTNHATLTLSSPFPYLTELGDFQITLEQAGEAPVTFPATQPDAASPDVVVADCSGTPEFIPALNAAYVLTIVTNGLDLYRILSIKRDSDELCEITAVQYDELIYEMADNTADIGAIPSDHSNLENPKRQSVTNTTASPKIYQDSAGVVKTGIEVFWTVPTGNSFWVGAEVSWTLTGTFNYQTLPMTTSGYALIPDITTTGSYQIVVCSIYKTGRQSIHDALSDDIYRPYAIVQITPYVPNDSFTAGISGLEVIGSLDGSYYGKECKLRWRAPVVVDQYTQSETTTPAAGNNTSSWLAYYQVEIRNTDGSLRRVTKVNTEAYSYTHEMDHEDGRPVRTYDVVVTAVDRLGRSSSPVTLRVTNPSPVAIS